MPIRLAGRRQILLPFYANPLPFIVGIALPDYLCTYKLWWEKMSVLPANSNHQIGLFQPIGGGYRTLCTLSQSANLLTCAVIGVKAQNNPQVGQLPLCLHVSWKMGNGLVHFKNYIYCNVTTPVRSWSPSWNSSPVLHPPPLWEEEGRTHLYLIPPHTWASGWELQLSLLEKSWLQSLMLAKYCLPIKKDKPMIFLVPVFFSSNNIISDLV